MSDLSVDDMDLTAPAAGRPLRVVLMTFYNFSSHAIRIFHPLLKQRGHEVHSVFLKDSFTYGHPTRQEEEMLLERVERCGPTWSRSRCGPRTTGWPRASPTRSRHGPERS